MFYARFMMKSMKATLLTLVALFAFSAVTVSACGGKKEEKNKTSKKVDDKAKAGGDKAKAGDDKAKAGDEDLCAKAEKCKDAWVKADPEGAKNVLTAWKFIETLEGDQKTEQCKQVLQGAGFNPKAPPECK